MSDLQLYVTTLRNFFKPSASGLGGPVIWAPDESDENFDFKRQLIIKAQHMLLAGENSLSGNIQVQLPSFEGDFEQAEKILEKDRELDKFLALINTCENIARCIHGGA